MNEGAAKYLENAIFKQAGKAGINSNKGFVNGAKGMIKSAAGWMDGATGGVVGNAMENNGVIQALKKTMSTSGETKKMVNRKLSQEEGDLMHSALNTRRDALNASALEEGADIAGIGAHSNALSAQMDNIAAGKGVNMEQGAFGNVKDYYGNKQKGAARAGITLGAYGAAAVGGRFASGGDLTTNNRGESDIAGIPFI